MSLKELLYDFSSCIAGATSAPDKYPVPEYQNYESNKADLKDLWSQIRPRLKRDLEQAQWVDAKLQEMFAAFDAGEKEKGRDAAWALYGSDVKKLR